MIKRLLQSAGPIGIDLGEDGARILQLGYDAGALRVVGSARVDLRSLGLTHTPADPAPDELVRAIARRVVAGGFQGRRCLIVLPDRAMRVRSARLPAMPEAELTNAVALDAPTHLGFAETQTDAQIGWLQTGDVYQGDDHRVELLYFGAETAHVEQLALAFEDAGLEPASIEPRFACVTRALTRTLRRAADADVVQMILDVCEEHTTVLITRGNNLVFCKVVDVGGRQMNEAAEQKLGLDPSTVRELRRQRARGEDDASQDQRIAHALFDTMRPTMAAIAREASLCLRHYSVTFRGSRPGACLLTGGEALEPGFDRVVSDVLGVEARVADPLDAVRTDMTIGGAQYGPAWAGAAGIAIRDLLKKTPSRKRNQRRSSKTPTPAPEAKGRAA